MSGRLLHCMVTCFHVFVNKYFVYECTTMSKPLSSSSRRFYSLTYWHRYGLRASYFIQWVIIYYSHYLFWWINRPMWPGLFDSFSPLLCYNTQTNGPLLGHNILKQKPPQPAWSLASCTGTFHVKKKAHPGLSCPRVGHPFMGTFSCPALAPVPSPRPYTLMTPQSPLGPARQMHSLLCSSSDPVLGSPVWGCPSHLIQLPEAPCMKPSSPCPRSLPIISDLNRALETSSKCKYIVREPPDGHSYMSRWQADAKAETPGEEIFKSGRKLWHISAQRSRTQVFGRL